MKKFITLLILASSVLFVKPAMAQTTPSAFNGAEATLPHYKALYYLDDADPKKIGRTLNNIKNALDDPRLKDKLEVELVAFSDGVAVYDKAGTFEETLLALQKRGVILAQCNNTIMERHIDKATLFPFISYVPSGNGEIIIRGQQGWTTVHP